MQPHAQSRHDDDAQSVLILFSHVPLSGSLDDARVYAGVYHPCLRFSYGDEGDVRLSPFGEGEHVFELLRETIQLGYDDVRHDVLTTYDLSRPEIASTLYLRALALADARTGARHVAALYTTATLDQLVDTLPDETQVYNIVLREAAYPPIWRITRCTLDGNIFETRELGLDIFEQYTEPMRNRRARRTRASASSSARRASSSSRRREQAAEPAHEPSIPLSQADLLAGLALPFDEETGRPIVDTPVIFDGAELEKRLLARVTPYLADHHRALRAGDERDK